MMKNAIFGLMASLAMIGCGDTAPVLVSDPNSATSNAVPKVVIGSPSTQSISTGHVSYKLKYTNVSKVSLKASQVSVKKTGDVTFTKSVKNGTSKTPTIVLTITGGTGKIDSISIPSGTGFNASKRKTAAASQSKDVIVDNTPPYVPVPPVVSLNTLDNINLANETSYSLSGTCSNEGDTISIIAPIDLVGSTVCASGIFSFSNLDVSGLNNGSIEFGVRIENADGSDVDMASVDKDAEAPTVSINAMPTITISNQSNFSISGACSNGDEVSFVSPAVAGTRTCAAGVYSFAGLNLSSFAQGSTTVTVRIEDPAGNQNTASRAVIKDTVAPSNPSCVHFEGKATPSKSDILNWNGSTDATSGISHYEMSIRSSSPGENIGWMNVGSSIQPHQFTSIDPKLNFDQDYYTYIRAVDNVGLASSEIACGPWRVSPGFGNFSGNTVDRKVDPEILNSSDPAALRYISGNFNDAYLSFHDESAEISVQEPGNYLLSLNMPMVRQNENDTGNVAAAAAMILVNGNAVRTGFSANSFTRGKTDGVHPIHASNNMTVLLDNLHEGDVISVLSFNNAHEREPLVIDRGSAFSTYLEYIPESAAALSAYSEKTTSGDNFNERDPAQFYWSKVISHDEYSFEDGTSEIKFGKGGDYIVSVNVPVMGDAEYQKIEARILINGRDINHDLQTVASNGLISGIDNHFKSSVSFTNVLYKIEPGDVLSIQTRQLGNRGHVTLPPKMVAALYIQKINTEEKFFISTGKAPRDMNVDDSIAWILDFASDRSLFTHNQDEKEIFIEQDGNYMAYVSSYMFSDTDQIRPITRILVNEKPYTGAACSNNTMIKEYDDTRFANCDMQIFLQGLKKGDAITFATTSDILEGSVEGFSPRITLKKVSESISRR